MNRIFIIFLFSLTLLSAKAQDLFVKVTVTHKLWVGYGATMYYKLDEFSEIKKNIESVQDSLKSVLMIWGLPLAMYPINECEGTQCIDNLDSLFKESYIQTFISSKNLDITLKMVKLKSQICEFYMPAGYRYWVSNDLYFRKIGSVVSFSGMEIGKKGARKFYKVADWLEKKLGRAPYTIVL